MPNARYEENRCSCDDARRWSRVEPRAVVTAPVDRCCNLDEEVMSIVILSVVWIQDVS
jgi:hypothetical protein